MNIVTPSPRAQQQIHQSAQAARMAFADHLVDISLTLPSAPDQRTLALQRLTTRIDAYFQTCPGSAAEACAVLSAILGIRVSVDALTDLEALVQRYPECRHAMAAVVQACQRQSARATSGRPAVTPKPEFLTRAALFQPGIGPVAVSTSGEALGLPPRVAQRPVDMHPVSHGLSVARHTRPLFGQDVLSAGEVKATAYEPALQGAEAALLTPIAALRQRRVITRPQRPEELEQQAKAQAGRRQFAAAVVPALASTPRASLFAPTFTQVSAASSTAMPSAAVDVVQPRPLSPPVVSPPPYTVALNLFAGSANERRPTPPARRHDFVNDVRSIEQRVERHGSGAVQAPQYDDQASGPRSIHSVASRVRLPPNGALPLALTDPKTRAPWVNPVYDQLWHVTCAGHADLYTSLPANHVADYTLRNVMTAWERYQNDPAALRRALYESLTCPISGQLFVTPVIAQDGYTYEESHILQWLSEHFCSPMTRAMLDIETLSSAQVIRYLLRELNLAEAADSSIAYADQRAKDKALSLVQAPPTIQTNLSDVQRAAFLQGMRQNIDHATRASGFGGDELDDMLTHVAALCNSDSRKDRAQGAQIIDSVISAHERFMNALHDRTPKSTMLEIVSDLYRMKKDYGKALQLFGDLSCPLPRTGGNFARIALLLVIRGEYTRAKYFASQCENYSQGTQYKHAALGELCRVRGEFPEALRHFDLADSGEEVPLREVAKWRKLANKRKTHRADL